jgi:hypothetical protein
MFVISVISHARLASFADVSPPFPSLPLRLSPVPYPCLVPFLHQARSVPISLSVRLPESRARVEQIAESKGVISAQLPW